MADHPVPLIRLGADPWLKHLLLLGAAMLTMGTASAQPLLCSEPKVAKSADRPQIVPATLAGTYRCVEEGLTITLRLDADSRFEYRLQGEAGHFSDAERAEFEEAGRTGRWRVEGRTLILFEQPVAAPTIQLVETARDPSVRMHVEIRNRDGRPARDLFIGEGAEANPQSELDEGVLIVPHSTSWEPGLRQIVRRGDDLKLASFTPTRDGANKFRFVYRPSEVEPFEIRADVMDAAGGAIGVPFGISGAILRRSVPGR